MLQLNPSIPVNTPKGDGEAILVIDYGIDVNTVWCVRFEGGKILHFYSDDIKIYGNPMNGKGWDVTRIDTVTKLPKEAKRDMSFLDRRIESILDDSINNLVHDQYVPESGYEQY